MAESRAAKYQRAFRERMRSQGLVQKLVYIRPEHGRLLSRVEKALQQHAPQVLVMDNHKGDRQVMGNSSRWTTASLFEALKDSELTADGRASVEYLQGAEPAINVVMHDFGDLPIELAASGEQIFCSTPLWDDSQIQDKAAFNEALLLINPINPLSNFGLMQREDGSKVYVVFGELSSSSALEQVVEEVEVLARNTLEAAEAFAADLIK